MDPARADFVVDLTYGVLIFVAVGLIVRVGSDVGVAFGIGVIVSYIVHTAGRCRGSIRTG
jgi:hypothetical protein